MINKDFFQALEDLEAEKKIDKDTFINTLETALTSAYKKMYGEAKSAMVKLNPEKATIRIYSYKTVVNEVEDPDKEISLAEARLIKNHINWVMLSWQKSQQKNLEELQHKQQNRLLCKNLKNLKGQWHCQNFLKKKMNF